MKETIKSILYEWKQRKLPEPIAREQNLAEYLTQKPSKIIVVSGFRRVGKTYLLLGLLKSLLTNIDREEAIYINFEDERIPAKTEFLTELIPTIKETFDNKIKYLFLDEVQNIPDWSKWLRRIYDTEDLRIFVSGSSSKLSSHEIPTELRGRFLEVKVFPLSLKEFLTFKGASFDLKAIDYAKDEKARLMKLLNEYLESGGLPEVVLSLDKKIDILQSYYQTVVRRDIIERHKIKNEEALKATILLLSNSKEYSISKLHNTLASAQYKIGKSTLQSYLGYFDNAFFLFSVQLFSYKAKDSLKYPRKMYFVDNGFITALSTKQAEGRGRLYENCVATTLIKNVGKNVFYWKSTSGEEVDFIVKDGLKIKQLIQVCYDVSDIETKRREERALLKAQKELGCMNLLVITADKESEEQVEWFGIKGTVTYIPLWKWLLNQ